MKYDGLSEFAKARLVARGFQDLNSYLEVETYSPVVSGCVMCWVLSIANRFGLHLCQLDVRTAFLYGELREPVYLQVPDGLDVDPSKFALRLKKALYGLKPASRLWYEKITLFLLNLGFKNYLLDQGLFYIHSSEGFAVLVVCVDDILIAGDKECQILEIVEALRSTFKINVLHDPKIFLGVEITRIPNEHKIILHQSSYILALARKYDLSDVKDVRTPMEPHLKITKTGVANEIAGLRSLVGALLFVARNTRPDILYAVNYVSRFQNEATNSVLKYAKRILKYLVSTVHLGLVFNSSSTNPLVSYVDAAFANCADDQCQSTSGFLIFNFGDLIFWSTAKQKSTATSTAEAEYQALNLAVKEILFVRNMLSEIVRVPSIALIYEDSTSAIRIAQGTESTASRFLLTKYYSIRQFVLNNEIMLKSISSKEQIADIMTKAPDMTTYLRIRDLILGPTRIL